MKSINLQRSIDVRCWRVIGQIAQPAKRIELMPVLLRAREVGSTDAADLAGHLLFESVSRRGVAQRLLAIAEAYGLLEEREHRYCLTTSGHDALQTEQVFVPEHGTWTIWASSDPLLATPIVRVEPWKEPSAYDEVRGNERDASRERIFEKLPSWLRAAIGSPLTPTAAGGAQLRIDQLEPKGEVVAEHAAALHASWDVSAARLRVEGTINGAQVSTVLDAPNITVEQVWKQLLQSVGFWSQWDPARPALRVGFDHTTPAERETLLRMLEFRHPAVEGLGGFNSTAIKDVALCAGSIQDANRWAEWRLRERIREYATVERFETWTKEAVQPFAEFDLITPSRRGLAESAWSSRPGRPTPYAWNLVAAEDWGL